MSHELKPPTTIKEVGIHIGYMSKDIAELKVLIARNIQDSATKDELHRVDERVTTLEKRDDTSKYYTRLEGRAVSAILSLAVLFLTLWNLISGKQ